jgi:hypothetical protein
VLIDLFEKVSKGTFWPDPKLVASGFPERLRWTVGQPLGTRGSFQSFSLSHNFLIRGIEKSIHGKVTNEFVVLGDDVVIFDGDVAREYLHALDLIGVKIATEKSVISYTSAEFAGYFIERDMMNRAGRTRATSGANVRSQAQALGAKAKEEIVLTMQDLQLVEAFARLPKSIGGFGWTTNQSLGEALNKDVTLSALAVILAEVPQEIFPDLTKDDPYMVACQHVCGILGFSMRELRDMVQESPSAKILGKTYVPLPIEIVDTMAYSYLLKKEEALDREAFAQFGYDTTTRESFVSRNKETLNHV